MQNKDLKVVFDTNIFISAFVFKGGKPEKIYHSALKRHFVLLTSPEIISEVALKLRNKFLWSEEKIVQKLKELARISDIIQPKNKLSLIHDESDNRFLECAIEGNANLIVSGDHHLLDLKEYNGIPIIRASDFVRIV